MLSIPFLIPFQVECYAEHETLGENKKAFSHVVEIQGELAQRTFDLQHRYDVEAADKKSKIVG